MASDQGEYILAKREANKIFKLTNHSVCLGLVDFVFVFFVFLFFGSGLFF